MPTLFLIVFVDLVGFGLVIPLLPFYAERFTASPLAMTALFATFSLMSFLTAPLWGRLSDRVGRRPVLMASMAASTLAYGWMAFATHLWMLFAARAFAGACAGNIAAAQAYIADVTPPEKRAKGMGMIGAAFGLGFIIGPVIGGVIAGDDIATADLATPCLIAAGLSSWLSRRRAAAAGKPVGARVASAPGTARHDPRGSVAARFGPSVAGIFSRDPRLLGDGDRVRMVGDRTVRVGAAPGRVRLLLCRAVVGGDAGRADRSADAASRRGAAVARRARRDRARARADAACRELALLLVAVTALALGMGATQPSINSLISRRAGIDQQGEIMGVAQSAGSLARVVGPLVAGALFAEFGSKSPFLWGAALVVAALAIGWRLPRAVAAPRAVPRQKPVGVGK